MVEVMITEAHLRQFIDDEQIFRFYIPQFKKIGSKFPIDENDKNPSASIFKAYNGTLLYKNFVNGDCFSAIQYVMNIKQLNYANAIQSIANDLGIPNITNLNAGIVVPKTIATDVVYKPSNNRSLKIKRKQFNNKELDYWKSFGIDKETLKYFKVSSLSMYWFDDVPYKPREMCFCYHFPEDNPYSYKLYFPINKRFLSSATIAAVQGYYQLNRSKKCCVITKSLKDVMFLYTLGINAVAPQSESCRMPQWIIDDLRNNFHCFIWYDNDRPGIRGALKMAKTMNIERDNIIIISQKLRKEGVKDPTDMRKIKGHDFTLEYINNLKMLYAKKFQN